MTRLSLKEVLMQRDGLEEYEADEMIEEAREDLKNLIYIQNGTLEEAEELIMDLFGLEPDYLDDILPL